MELKWEFMVLLGLLKYFAGLEMHYISWWPYLTSATISVTKAEVFSPEQMLAELAGMKLLYERV